MSLIIRVEPKITSGMLIASPKINSSILPPAAAATAITLSRLMTRSASKMVRTAAIMLCLTTAPPSSSSSSLLSRPTPIHSSSSPPMTSTNGSCISRAATTVSAIRSTTAAPEPSMTAFFCCSGGKPRAARAMTTALSPERMMLIQTILSRPIQKSLPSKASMANIPICNPTDKRPDLQHWTPSIVNKFSQLHSKPAVSVLLLRAWESPSKETHSNYQFSVISNLQNLGNSAVQPPQIEQRHHG